MTASLIVHFCLLVIVACCAVVYLSDKLGRLRKWLAAHDERALLNRQRQAARDREDRETERRADRMAQIHGVMTGDVIHPTTPYCDYLDTPRDAMPRVRKPLTEREWGLLTAARDMNKLKADQAQRTIDRIEATPTAAELIGNAALRAQFPMRSIDDLKAMQAQRSKSVFKPGAFSTGDK